MGGEGREMGWGGEGYGGQTVRRVKVKKQNRCGKEKTTGVRQQVGPGQGRQGGGVVGEVGGRGSGGQGAGHIRPGADGMRRKVKVVVGWGQVEKGGGVGCSGSGH